jgi:mono/diheme cytochrome c family protein
MSSIFPFRRTIPLSILLSMVWLASPLQAGGARERGEYLVRAGNCVSCHTTPGGRVFTGGVPFPTDFGTIYSTNITPDRGTGIGGWTLQQFDAAMRKGERPDGTHLYPAFPYTSFTKLSDEDVATLYEYFMDLRPVAAPAKANDMSYPFGKRALLGPWKAMFFDEGRFQADGEQTAQWNRGAYLVQGLAHCGACHTPRNLLGAEKQSRAFSGGVLREVMDDRDVARAAPDLTPAAHGLGAWSEDDIADYLKLGVSSRARLMGTMNEVILNSTRHLTAEDNRAMAVYLKSLPPSSRRAARPDEDLLELGSKQYDIHCGSCHLPTGLGSDDTGPPLAGSTLAQAPDPSSLIDLVLRGARVPVEAPSAEWRSRPWQSMTPFAQKLSDEQAAALLTYVRNAWGNSAGVVEPHDIDRLR